MGWLMKIFEMERKVQPIFYCKQRDYVVPLVRLVAPAGPSESRRRHEGFGSASPAVCFGRGESGRQSHSKMRLTADPTRASGHEVTVWPGWGCGSLVAEVPREPDC